MLLPVRVGTYFIALAFQADIQIHRLYVCSDFHVYTVIFKVFDENLQRDVIMVTRMEQEKRENFSGEKVKQYK